MTVLKRNVQDHDNNVTKFVLVGENPISLRHPFTMKTTIMITLPEDYPGALHQVLSAFAWRRINLSKIESRPTKKQLGNYYFYIDIEESLDSVLVPNAIQEIEAIGCQVRILAVTRAIWLNINIRRCSFHYVTSHLFKRRVCC